MFFNEIEDAFSCPQRLTFLDTLHCQATTKFYPYPEPTPEWGRDGQAGQTRTVPYPTPDAAQSAFERQRRAKERKGYTTRSAGKAF